RLPHGRASGKRKSIGRNRRLAAKVRPPLLALLGRPAMSAIWSLSRVKQTSAKAITRASARFSGGYYIGSFLMPQEAREAYVRAAPDFGKRSAADIMRPRQSWPSAG